jgi:3-oxoacid CoA-transferase subunit B
MDLVHGAKRITVVMEHTIKDGSPRLVRECTRPLTGKALVDRVITDLAILDVEAGTFRVVELAPGADPENYRTAHRRSAALAKDGAKGPSLVSGKHAGAPDLVVMRDSATASS